MTQNIVKRARNGNKPALAELYDRYAPLVRALCFDRTGDLQLALDITQDVFLIVLTELSRLKHPSRFQQWLMAIAHNKLADHYRCGARTQRLKERISAESFDPVEKEQQMQLRKAISSLPEQERLAVHLFYIEGMPAKNISQLLHLPLRTAYSVLARARKSLKRQLSQEALP